MKAVLASLLGFVLVQSQAFALSGGPVYPVGSYIQGTYAGVLLPDPSDPATATNTLGLFNFTVPATGLSTGTFLMFASGSTFTGTINGLADPDKSSITAILEAHYTISVTTFDIFGTPTTTTINANALGPMNADIVPNTIANGSGLPRLTGTAKLDIDHGLIDPVTLAPVNFATLNMIVDGIEQQVTPPTTTTGG
jgi:hypothetical protein